MAFNRSTWLGWALAVAATLFGWLGGCSSSGDGDGGRAGIGGPIRGGDGDGDGDGDHNPGPRFGNSDASVGGDGGRRPVSAEPDVPDGGCAATSEQAEQVVIEEVITHEETIEEVQPVALYIVFDQSSSMDMGNLWVPAKEALKSFVRDPRSEGIDVALDFFPDPLNFDCTGVGYDQPTVPMGRLSAHAPNIVTELDARPLAGQFGTPIEAALRGGTLFCQRFEDQNPNEDCVVVLVTDGAPFGACLADTPSLAAIAGAAYDGGAGVRTFTVGLMGADFALLDEIARMGGAVDCDEADDTRFSCDVSAGPDRLADALSRIREVVTRVETRTETVETTEERPLPCEWEIPAPPEGEVFDREKVNVQLDGSDSDATTLGRVGSADQCAELGWHYDDPDDPTRIVACEQTCTTIQSTPGARVDILLGCATIPLE